VSASKDTTRGILRPVPLGAADERAVLGPVARKLGWARGAALLALLATSYPVLGCDVIVDTSKRAPCATHAECTQRFGEPSACIESTCVKLLSEECSEVLPAGVLEKDNVILFGFMGALKGDFASYGTPTKEGAQLAFEEVESSLNGIPGVGNQGQRHVGMLVCDHGADPKKVARHLTEDVKVPAIIGPSFSGVTLQVLDVTVPAKTLLISASATSPALTDVADDGLFWRTCPSDVVQAELLKFLLVDVGDSLRTSGTVPMNGDPQVALLYKDDSAGRGLQLAATTMQDGPGAAPAVMNAYQDKYPNPETDTVDWTPHVNGAVDDQPNVILALGTSEFVQDLMPPIEAKWNASLPRPWYLLPEGDRVVELTKYVTSMPSLNLASRVIGTAPGARKSPLYTQFAGRFSGTFDHRQPGNLAEFAYDAAYLLLYATAISGQPNPTGPELADALTHVHCGTKTVEAGPSTEFNNFFELAMGSKCIDFEGASGPLDFNTDTGEAVSDIAMWCLRTQGEGFTFDPPLDSYYSASEQRIVWKNDKPLDFTVPNWCNLEGK